MPLLERPRHVFTLDVEDYFHSEDSQPLRWDRYPLRVERSTQAVLETCDRAGVCGTFFVLAWVAMRLPRLVREIADAGHEVASHGRDHQFVYQQLPDQFREDVTDARARLEDIVQRRVLGYRAPYFSIVGATPWAHPILAEAGYRYSSSVFPGVNPRYGIPGHSALPLRVAAAGEDFWEVPITTFASRIGCGGVYFRAFPYLFFRAWLTDLERKGRLAVFYLHPWETDTGKPMGRGSLAQRLRHDVGIGFTLPRLRRLFRDFEFTTIASRLATAGFEIDES
jgi:polysaccharide deacetylase family protein (PEP-CTERM system associated)